MESNKNRHSNGDRAPAVDSGGAAIPAFGALEFAQESAAALGRIEQAIIDADIDADAGFISDGVLEVEFDDGGKMIINRHDVSREIWVAGRTGAYHFRWDGTGWVDTRSGESLLAVVSGLVSQMAGQKVVLG